MLIGRLGPFEPNPVIAAAVSGGPDSMALLLLLSAWAKSRDGHVVAMTVDHAIRAESAAEAAEVAAWSAKLEVEHLILKWDKPRPELAGIQERARQARYRLLDMAARQRGILHVAVAHHANDQAETLLMRLARGSGVDGLAGMPAISERGAARIIRPLLDIPAARLKATCAAHGQPWVDDPSNRSLRHDRPRLRVLKPVLEDVGLMPEALGMTARRMAGARICLEDATAGILARAATIFPQGFARLTIVPWQRENAEIRNRCLARLLLVIGNDAYAPRAAKLAALSADLSRPAFMRATLGGCVIEQQGENLMFMRETRHDLPETEIRAGEKVLWNGFEAGASMPAKLAPCPPSFENIPEILPARVLAYQPAFYDHEGLAAVPTLGFYRDGVAAGSFRARFAPRRAVTESIFSIV